MVISADTSHVLLGIDGEDEGNLSDYLVGYKSKYSVKMKKLKVSRLRYLSHRRHCVYLELAFHVRGNRFPRGFQPQCQKLDIIN